MNAARDWNLVHNHLAGERRAVGAVPIDRSALHVRPARRYPAVQRAKCRIGHGLDAFELDQRFRLLK